MLEINCTCLIHVRFVVDFYLKHVPSDRYSREYRSNRRRQLKSRIGTVIRTFPGFLRVICFCEPLIGSASQRRKSSVKEQESMFRVFISQAVRCDVKRRELSFLLWRFAADRNDEKRRRDDTEHTRTDEGYRCPAWVDSLYQYHRDIR